MIGVGYKYPTYKLKAAAVSSSTPRAPSSTPALDKITPKPPPKPLKKHKLPSTHNGNK